MIVLISRVKMLENALMVLTTTTAVALLASLELTAALVHFFILLKSTSIKGATSRYFAPVFAPNKTIVKLKETKTYTHGKIEKY